MNTGTTIILADGDFPSHSYPLDILSQASRVICCDGAVDRYTQWGGVPTAIVGDCDSISADNATRFAHILHPDTDQDYNDLSKAVNYSLTLGWNDITILGATGRREDHTLGNISILAQYTKRCKSIHMISDYGIFTPIEKDENFESFVGQQVSIFSLDPAQKIIYEGLLYQLPENRAQWWWSGTLNESLGEQFTIRCSHPVIVFQNFEH